MWFSSLVYMYTNLFNTSTIARTSQTQLRALPTFKDTGWRPPRSVDDLPSLKDCCFISHDTENREFDFDHGSGWGRGKVRIVGHALTGYWRNGESVSMYLPMRHEVDTHLNLDPDKVTRYVRDQLQTKHIPKGYANGLYDIGTSTTDSIYVQGELHDVQFAEALLTEDEQVALDVLAKKYLGVGKTTNSLYEWCAAAYGGEPTGSQRGNIYRTSPILVGPYAEQDSSLIRPVLHRQWAQLDAEQLVELYRMECKLIRLLVRMRLQGVRVDLPYIDTLSNDRGTGEVDLFIAEKIAEFKWRTGIQTSDSCPTGDIAKAFDQVGISYRLTEKTKKPSITKDDLKVIIHPVAKLSSEIREYGKIRSTFLRGTLLERHVNGIIHGSFEPLRGDEGGARTGRFVSNNPNLQTIPVRSEMGKRIRKAFIPFYGHYCWEKNDFSQYEYRILAHYAVGPGSDELRAKYRADPKTDYHTQTGQMILEKTGKELPRKRIKTINFGLMNLMGVDLLASEMGLTAAEVKPLLDVYHNANPYVKATVKKYELEAQTKGYVTTLLNRRRRFNMWEPIPQWSEETKTFKKWLALPFNRASAEYGSFIQRAMAHIALNTKTQGTNADGIKAAMVKLDEDGIFDVIGVPTLTVHDELDHSVIDDSPAQREAYREQRHIMETAMPLNVPTVVEGGRGENWGSIE